MYSMQPTGFLTNAVLNWRNRVAGVRLPHFVFIRFTPRAGGSAATLLRRRDRVSAQAEGRGPGLG
jgi:hypothetical protein